MRVVLEGGSVQGKAGSNQGITKEDDRSCVGDGGDVGLIWGEEDEEKRKKGMPGM